MLRWLLLRCLWLLPMLLGISLVTFLALDLAPLDRASLELAQRDEPAAAAVDQRAVALARLRIRYGLVDPTTLEPVPVLQRYGRWLEGAVRLDLAGPGEDAVAFRGRIARAVPVTLLVGSCALLLALLLGVPLGVWLGMRAGGRADRAVSALMFTALGLPEVLVATLLLLSFGAAGLGWLPTTGLRSAAGADLRWPGALGDLAAHLVMPVAVMALGPLVLVARFLRESVARAAAAPFAQNLAAWGIDRAVRRRRLLRVGFAPVATLVGGLLPMLVTGSIVVESVFGIDGVGRLFWDAVRTQEHAMVMAVTLLVSVVTLLALLLSDLLHRWVDPRVRLQP